MRFLFLFGSHSRRGAVKRCAVGFADLSETPGGGREPRRMQSTAAASAATRFGQPCLVESEVRGVTPIGAAPGS